MTAAMLMMSSASQIHQIENIITAQDEKQTMNTLNVSRCWIDPRDRSNEHSQTSIDQRVDRSCQSNHVLPYPALNFRTHPEAKE
jgi:hypothetical protein